MKKQTLLGGLTPNQFLRDYWHKKPLLIRQAFPAFHPPVTRDALFALSASDEVESRLITHFDQNWQLKQGPFKKLPPMQQANWTLLVQGVNLHNEQANAIMRQFCFLPDARLDDLMISYATDGGGVGPHTDSYDVFLLQAHGQRHWRISKQKDLTLIDGSPLKILREFYPDQEFVLAPGDMLYLPPNYAHDGVAVGECMTYSIGFRAPSYQELGEAFLQFMADSIDLSGRYADPQLKPTTRPAAINSEMIASVTTALNKINFTRDDISIFLGEYLSESKPNVFFTAPQSPLTSVRFLQAARKRGISLSHKTRMLYHGRHIFINGASFVARHNDKVILAELANQRILTGNVISEASTDVQETLYSWYDEGWLNLTPNKISKSD